MEENLPPPSRGNKSSKLSTEPQETPSSKITVAESPPSIQPPPASHKKGGRPPNSRKGKLGRNQYSKDKEQHENDNISPGRSQSRDISRYEETTNNQRSNNNTANDSKVPKSKNLISSKISWPELRRRVENYLNFISQTQIEMAQDPTFLKRTGNDGNGGAMREMLEGMAGQFGIGDGSKPKDGEKDFKDLSVVEMMDYLTREMIKWQKDFAA